MKKNLATPSIISAVVFLWGAISALIRGRGVVEGSILSFLIEAGLQSIIGFVFFSAFISYKSENSIAGKIFRFGCILSVIYIVTRSMAAVINARQQGMMDFSVLAVMALLAILFSSVFIYFFQVSKRIEN